MIGTLQRCADCGCLLSPNELKYYGRQCETCVGFEFEQELAEIAAAHTATGAIAWIRQHGIEALAALSGLLGAFLLAGKGEHAAWGWVAFLASNAGWIAFGWIRGHWWLVLQQVGFTASSLLGVWRWLL